SAREKNADLIALATHGRGGLARLLMGSVAEEVLRHSPIPVLLTRPGMVVHDFKRIAVALDGSERGESILTDVVPLARKLKAGVDVLRVALPVMMAGFEGIPAPLPPEGPRPHLQGIANRLAAQGRTA